MFTGRAPIAQPPGSDTSASPAARHQRAEHEDRGAHGLDHLVGRIRLAQRGRVHLHMHALANRDVNAHATEQLDHRGDVLQVRDVRDRHRPVGEQGAREDRQRRVLGARDAHFALERHATLDLQLVHAPSPRRARRPPRE